MNDIKEIADYMTSKHPRTYVVEILEDDPTFNIRKGYLFLARPYWLDPREKMTLLHRVNKSLYLNGFVKTFNRVPECNQYLSSIKILQTFGK